MTNSIMQTIDISLPVNCPRWEETHDHIACQGCRFWDICKSAHEEYGK
jgi:hypothetical protein